MGLHGGLSLSLFVPGASVVRMKNLKSLQVVALAGVAVALTAGCSSTSSTRADYNSSDSNAAYRFTSAGGWVPITDAAKMAIFPQGWVPGGFGPVSYESYVFAPPADRNAIGSPAITSSSSSSSTTISTDGSQTIVSSDHPTTTVSTPSATVTTPSASVSTPVASVSTPSATVSTPSASVTADYPATTTVASDGSSTTVTTTSPAFSENMRPGDTFVEAAGANSDTPKVRRVILYTPFGAPGVH
jgi:hypothetical protein